MFKYIYIYVYTSKFRIALEFINLLQNYVYHGFASITLSTKLEQKVNWIASKKVFNYILSKI